MSPARGVARSIARPAFHSTSVFVKRVLLLGLVVFGFVSASCPEGTTNSSGVKPVGEIDTSMGKILVELNDAKAPITVKNFLAYVDEKHYDGMVFHRVMPDFMIQGGGFQPGIAEARSHE